MRVERQIDAGRSECRAQHARTLLSDNNGQRQLHNYRAMDSSMDEGSDDELDLGGPEGNAPLPDNDETLGGTSGPIDVSRWQRQQQPEEEDFDDHRRRASSAPVSPSLARQRRRQIATSLGITSERPSPSWTPPRSAGNRNVISPPTNIDGRESRFDTMPSFGERQASQGGPRRRLSTGGLWFNRFNRAPVPDTAFGSGISDEEVHSGDELASDKSFEKHM